MDDLSLGSARRGRGRIAGDRAQSAGDKSIRGRGGWCSRRPRAVTNR